MSVFGMHHIDRHSVVPLERTADEYSRTVYEGDLVWFTPPVTGGKVAARLIHINFEEKTVEIEITATGNRVWLRGTREFHIPFTRVYSRNVTKNLWFKSRFSKRWVDYPTAKERNGAEWQRLVELIKNQ